HFELARLEHRFLVGDFAGAAAIAAAAEPLLPTVTGFITGPWFAFYHALTSTALHAGAGDLAADQAARLESTSAVLRHRAAGCPSSFLHMSLLVDAERARTRGDGSE